MIYEHVEKKQDDINFYFCGVDEDLVPGVQYGPVIREICMIECCTGGYGTVVINGKEFPVIPGDCIALLPGDTVIHKADREQPRSAVWCGVGGMKVANQLKSAGVSSSMPYLDRSCFAAVRHWLYMLYDMKDEKDAGAQLRRNGVLHLLLGEICRRAKRDATIDRYTEQAIKCVEMRYSEGITVDSIAREIGLERSYFSTLFKKAAGKTPHEYLTEFRIKKACELLEFTDFTVGEISRAVGIEPVNFSRVFKVQMGCLPTEYQTLHNKAIKN